jgi:type VI secretion system protein ImpA
MNTIDIAPLLVPVSADAPAGADLEYDPDFLALMEAGSGTPERQMGNTVVPAQEPDWRRVLELGKGLLGRSKDLRIAVPVTRALFHLKGLQGLDDGLRLIQGLIATFWDGLHPELDASDNNDPTARLNCLVDLADRDTTLAALREVSLIRSRAFGPVSYRDIEIAQGRSPAPADAEALDATAVNGAFQDCDLDQLAAAAAAANGSLATLNAIGSDLATRVESAQIPDLTPLTGLLAHIRGVLQAHLTARQPDAAPATANAESPSPAASSPGTGTSISGTGQISSREDVVRALDRLCDYYSRQEPSSPVPLLLQRARRLATGNFLDIMRDLAPDALQQIEKVCGVDDKT